MSKVKERDNPTSCQLGEKKKTKDKRRQNRTHGNSTHFCCSCLCLHPIVTLTTIIYRGANAKSCQSLLDRVEQNDPQLTDLVILPNKTFGQEEIDRLIHLMGTYDIRYT